MSEREPGVLYVDGVPVGRVTDFHPTTARTGPVHELKSISPADVTPSRVTLEFSAAVVFDPFASAPAQPPAPNRSQRRKVKRRK